MVFSVSSEIDSPQAINNKRTNLIVIDEQPAMRYGICELINKQPDFNIISDTRDFAAGLELINVRQPDILLLGMEIKCKLYTYQLITEVVKTNPQIRVIIYTSNEEESHVVEAIRCGASAYVVKSSPLERLFEAIRTVANNGSYLDPVITSLVTGRIGRRQERRGPHSRELSQREQQVLRGLVSGKRNREIAEELFISEHTVKYHVKSMFTKLQVTSRSQIVKIALQNGFV